MSHPYPLHEEENVKEEDLMDDDSDKEVEQFSQSEANFLSSSELGNYE